jgi:hypothetical protein
LSVNAGHEQVNVKADFVRHFVDGVARLGFAQQGVKPRAGHNAKVFVVSCGDVAEADVIVLWHVVFLVLLGLYVSL